MALDSNNNIDFIEKLISAPQEALEHLNLKYVARDQLSILRIRKENGFLYLYKNKPLLQKKQLKRIKELVIPPAWADVKIAPLENAHLQAIGADSKKRTQYRYHPIWLKLRNRTKFYKMLPFGKALPKIRARVEKDLELPGWPKNKVLALIVRLMEETHIRVGNEQYAKRNKTYGLSTLRTKHIKQLDGKIRFEFTGKKGKKHKITLRNKKLIHLVNKCEEIPGWELFQFYNDNGEKMSVDSGMVNDYIHEISGHLFTAKDFRTWAGTVIFFETLGETPITAKKKSREKNIIKAYDATAKALGNTRNVCKKYYVHPLIPKMYNEGVLDNYLDQADKSKENNYYAPSEITVLQLIEKYKPLKNLN
ncbi:DNA topoisomerase IB [Maribacter sp. 2210JD10-5]|uniref:DNA topoisomerase IB n=1 Tax=Maribacter sp. 2210JD10-5 TaxID=3386272 RepID=UPI0039BC7AA8